MNENMQEHRKYKVRCVVFGSKPEPRIEWFINGERIIDQYATVRFFFYISKALIIYVCLLWKIAACYFLLVIQSLLFWKKFNFLLLTLTNNKQKINYFLNQQALDDQQDFACYFQSSRFQIIRAKNGVYSIFLNSFFF